METILVTRHAAVEEWLAKHYPELEIDFKVETASVEDVKDRLVVGNIPGSLAASAYAVLSLEAARPSRGRELSLEEMESCGYYLFLYQCHPNIRGTYAIGCWDDDKTVSVGGIEAYQTVSPATDCLPAEWEIKLSRQRGA